MDHRMRIFSGRGRAYVPLLGLCRENLSQKLAPEACFGCTASSRLGYAVQGSVGLNRGLWLRAEGVRMVDDSHLDVCAAVGLVE